MKQFLRFRGCYCPNSKRPLTHKIVIVSLFLAFTISYAQGQPSSATRIAGTVLSAETGQLLEGASIKVTGRGGALPKTPDTQTDAEGTFALYTSLTEGIIQVSYIGYLTQTIQFSPIATSPFTIKLERDENALQEVEINAGYYTVKERERTGSISRITAETIERQVAGNLLTAMQGQMAGVEITQQSSIPGGAFQIRIRGENSLRQDGNEPLYLIDGVPFTSQAMSGQLGMSVTGVASPLNILNANDIASIEVLKDADATAIYGSRGANGVVLISTRRNQQAGTQVAVNAHHGISKVRRFAELLTTPQYLEMRREAFRNDAMVPTLTNAYDLLLWDTLRYTDWQQTLLGGTAHNSQLQASLSGETGGMSFLIRGGLHRETNVFPEEGAYRKASALVNLRHTGFGERLTVQLSANYGADRNDLPNRDLTIDALTLPPNAPELYNEEGKLNWGPGNWFSNPLVFAHRPLKRVNNHLNSSLDITYRPLAGLSAGIRAGFNDLMLDDIQLFPASTISPASTDPRSSSNFYTNRVRGVIAEPQLDYSVKVPGGKLQALLGGTMQYQVQEGGQLNATGFISEAMMWNKAAAERLVSTANSYSQYRYAAVFSRLNYQLKERYILNLTARRDGSSRFGPGRQWASFGAVGGAWLFAEEPVVRRVAPWLDGGKLRGSYGITGSDQIANYMYLNSYTTNAAQPYLGVTLHPARLANRNYGWESNRKLEVALEVSVLRNRIQASAAWYRNQSSSQLIGMPLPELTGFTSVQHNFPATVTNKGWETELRVQAVQTPVFSWQAAFNATFSRRVLEAFPDIASFPMYASVYEVGERMDRQRRYTFTGVDPQTGFYTVADVDGNGAYNVQADGFWFTPALPVFGGLSQVFRLKDVQLDVFFRFSRQHGLHYFNAWALPGTISNQPAGVMDRWQEEGQEAAVQKFSQRNNTSLPVYNRWKASDGAMTDNSYLRLQHVSLSWSLPASVYRPLKLRQAGIYLKAQNLFTFTAYEGLDPETFNTSLPPLRTLVAGARFTF